MPLGIPAPPTDSLYTFVALGGILVLAASLYVPDELVFRVEEKEQELQTKAAVILEREHQVQNRLTQIEELVDNAIAEQQGTCRHDPAKLQLTYSESELKNPLDEQNSIAENLAVSVVEWEGLESQVQRLKDRA